MTPPPTIIDGEGRPIPLHPQLASGGEGAVFLLKNDPKLVAKVYHRPPTDQTAEKLAAMTGLANDRLLAMAAWPKHLVYHPRPRRPAGFVMPLVENCRPIQQLYNPIQRLKVFPRNGWDFQVRAAMNLAAAFDEVHKANCLVGDVNQSNVQVSSTAMVHLIDCDSFQVRIGGRSYLCEVGVPHYTPPELQGQPFRGLVRTENHDRFGLAVLIYQLLFVGRHPYSGKYTGPGDPSYEDLIAQFRFAQGPMAPTWGMAPPPHTPTLADIPPDLGLLIRRSFERGSESGNRPRPAEWLDALRKLESEVVTCSVDAGHKSWRGAGGCVWCRLAERGGPEYYFGISDESATFAVDESKLAEVIRRLAATRPVEMSYEKYRQKLTPAIPPRANPLPEDIHEHQYFTVLLFIATVLFLMAIPFGLWRGFIGAVGLLGTFVFGSWLVIDVLRSPWYREMRRREIQHHDTLARLDAIEAEWSDLLRRDYQAHDQSSGSIRKRVAECRGLGSAYQAEMSRLATNAEAMSRLRHLRLHLISDAEIPKIGTGRKQILAMHQINTAADINKDAIQNIKGFGETLTANLLAWREEILRRFHFDPKTAISPAEKQSLTMRFRKQQERILVELNQQMSQLESTQAECRASIGSLISTLKKAVEAHEQARSDLALLRKGG